MDDLRIKAADAVCALIADILQVPVSFFSNREIEESISSTIEEQRAEIVRLFDALPDEANRLQLIEFARIHTRLAKCRASSLSPSLNIAGSDAYDRTHLAVPGQS